MTLPGSLDPSSLAYCIYMKVIFQGLIKIREGIYKNAKKSSRTTILTHTLNST